MAVDIFTIGYQGTAPADLVATLGAAGVRTLIDVRAVAVSRKPGFSKKALAEAVEAAGMAYVHLVALGCPKPGRDAARAGRHEEFEHIFSAHLAGVEAEKALAVASLIASTEGPACLLCFEADPQQCHRSILAGRLAARLGATIHDLHPVQ
jgi:uncharacterized protein (DUF488 family)